MCVKCHKLEMRVARRKRNMGALDLDVRESLLRSQRIVHGTRYYFSPASLASLRL